MCYTTKEAGVRMVRTPASLQKLFYNINMKKA